METMIPQKVKSDQEICNIRITFPVESDEKAIEYKKKITAVLADIPEAQIQFLLIPNNAITPVR